MKLKKTFIFIVLTAAVFLQAFSQSQKPTPVQKHGQLHVQAGKLVDEHSKAVQLYGMSTHGIAWFPQYVNKELFRQLRDEWNTNCVRIAMYTEEYGGYCSGGSQEELKSLVCKSVDMATQLGLYVIVDWHVLHDQTPEKYESQAMDFFNELSERCKQNVNVLYEICNEPNGGTSWEDIRRYAEKIIPVIRRNSPDAVVLVGTPFWSSGVEQAAQSPLDFEDIMYVYHFYAGTHKEQCRLKLKEVLDRGLPVFVTEFGTCDASGNGGFDKTQTEAWFRLLDEYKVSCMNWALANKNESACAIKSSVSKCCDLKYRDLSESGQLVYEKFRSMEQ